MSMDPAPGIGDRPPLPLRPEAPAPGSAGPTGAGTHARLNIPYYLVIGVAIGVVAIFTALAWPFAILTGIVIGKVASDRRLGRRDNATVTQFLAVTGGVLGMLFFGVLLGGLIGFLIVALAAFSERVAEDASPVDQVMARIIIALVGAVVWGVLWIGLGIKINLAIGG
ncbi:MAG TPA: hypothetical protein VNL94_08200 [Candidatus Binatia bacterium]|nr:hypothetical protein [Candidatus Binatia bacterium]